MLGGGENYGYFAVTNLLGPRIATQTAHWHDGLTFVQLRYEFLNNATGGALTIGRTFFTFYDFDTGLSQVEGAVPAVECTQFGTQVVRSQPAYTPTEIESLSPREFIDQRIPATAPGTTAPRPTGARPRTARTSVRACGTGPSRPRRRPSPSGTNFLKRSAGRPFFFTRRTAAAPPRAPRI